MTGIHARQANNDLLEEHVDGMEVSNSRKRSLHFEGATQRASMASKGGSRLVLSVQSFFIFLS